MSGSSWQKTFMHEMFHVFGFGHMMRRKDRAEYVTVLEESNQSKKAIIIFLPIID